MRRIYIAMLILLLMPHQKVYGDVSEVRIALIDTGISQENLEADYIFEGINYIEPGSGTEDVIGHGTAIAGIIIGSKGLYIKGIVPKGVKLVPLVISTESVDGTIVVGDSEMIAQAIYDAIDLYGCQVINISAGLLDNDQVLEKAVAYAEEKGSLVVSAVGNDYEYFPDHIYYPAAYETVIGVGALDKKGEVSSFSQRNESVAICAPGEKLKLVSINKGHSTFGFGTSYATAYVSAAAALLYRQQPEASPEEIRQLIYQSAEDIATLGYDTESGWGKLNLALGSVTTEVSIDKQTVNYGLCIGQYCHDFFGMWGDSGRGGF